MIKLIWAFRSFIYNIFIFDKFGFLGYLGRPIFISGAKNIRVGARVRIFPGSRLECLGKGRIDIYDNVSIGQRLHVVSSRQITIGKNCLLAENIFIADSDHSFDISDVPYHSQPLTISETYIGDNCFLGYGAVILAGTHLGSNCVVGAYSVLRGEYPENSMIVGSPARVIKKFNCLTHTWENVNAK